MDVFRVRYCVNIFFQTRPEVYLFPVMCFLLVKPPDFSHLTARAPLSEERTEAAFQFRAPQSEHAGGQRSRVEARTCEDVSCRSGLFLKKCTKKKKKVKRRCKRCLDRWAQYFQVSSAVTPSVIFNNSIY